ncbi:MAG: glutamate-5-semialdehyde dehydrogenase [Oscillospiraceae bacterium]
MVDIYQIGKMAKTASYEISSLDTKTKNAVLTKMAEDLIKNTSLIIKENEKDIQTAKQMGIKETMIDRLALDEKRIKAMADCIIQIAKVDDPIGITLSGCVRPNGLEIKKVTTSLGVVGIIYESRPNVTADAGALCFKAGNAVILKGGKEAVCSNKAIANSMRQTIKSFNLNENIINLIEDTTRETTNKLMKMSEYIDVLIPRGGASLIKAVTQNSSIPVIETGTGNCHIFVDYSANLQMAVDIIFNAKTSRPSVCNAAESMLIHKDIANKILPLIKEKLDEKNVLIKGCEKSLKVLPNIEMATDEDYYTEFLDYIISLKIVEDIKEAVFHINKYGTGHSEVIVTQSHENARYFTKNVDAAAVYVNASSRFTDGEEFGFGAEIGISTQKLHARGPMGLKELTTYKYIIEGDGQIR